MDCVKGSTWYRATPWGGVYSFKVIHYYPTTRRILLGDEQNHSFLVSITSMKREYFSTPEEALQNFLTVRGLEKVSEEGEEKMRSSRYVIDSIMAERCRQVKKWGVQKHSAPKWHLILSEEIGELGEAILQSNHEAKKEELVQIAAVALAWLACIKMRKMSEIPEDTLEVDRAILKGVYCPEPSNYPRLKRNSPNYTILTMNLGMLAKAHLQRRGREIHSKLREILEDLLYWLVNL